MSALEAIRDFHRINDRLATSGMPRVEQFAAIGQAGFDTVINLALSTSDDALPNEGELVAAQGMTYVHLPVKFDAPQPADFARFTRLMDACAEQRVFVHCAANKRVSAFLFLHRLRHGAARNEAERDLRQLWEQDGVWRDFVNARLAELNQVPL